MSSKPARIPIPARPAPAPRFESRRPPVPPDSAGSGTGYFCPVCGWEFLPEEIGKKPYCRRCGYLES